MASVGAASTTFDEMISTIHLNKTTHSLQAYKELLEDLIVSLLFWYKLVKHIFIVLIYLI